MSEIMQSYPNEESLGKECRFWIQNGSDEYCGFPKMELEGRTTCGGIVDSVCLRIKDGKPASDFIELLLAGSNIGLPDSSLLPPGEIE